MNTNKVYQQVMKGGVDLAKTEEQKVERANKEHNEELERADWLALPHTQLFLKALEIEHKTQLACVKNSVSLNTPSDLSIRQGITTITTLEKVISLAKTGKYAQS